MIVVKEENIFNSTENIIGQQVNCFKMGRGLAKEIATKYPVVLSEFNKVVKDDNIELLGRCQFVEIGKDKYIANLFGQYKYGTDKQYTRYDCLYYALCELKNWAQFKDYSIALPYYIGAGLGGGDADDIHKVINKVFWDYSVTLYKKK